MYSKTHTINVEIAAQGTTFNVFSYNVVWAKNWTQYLPKAERIFFKGGLMTTQSFYPNKPAEWNVTYNFTALVANFHPSWGVPKSHSPKDEEA